MKIVAECYKNPEFSERHLKNDTLERADWQDIDRPSEQGV
jgi:hypothetical protein